MIARGPAWIEGGTRPQVAASVVRLPEVMPRISKAPQERRNELIDAAERLFNERGFEETAVSHIVQAVKVAQGTFYCYFKTKTAVLEAVVTKQIDLFMTGIQEIVEAPAMAPGTKLAKVVNSLCEVFVSGRRLQEYLNQESNLVMREKFRSMAHARLKPLMAAIIREGVAQGQFQVAHPDETAGALLAASFDMLQNPSNLAAAGPRARLRETLDELLTRALGAKSGGIPLDW